MKNLARLLIFFSLTFVILFIFSCLFRFLSSWIDSVRVISPDPEQGAALIAAARTALPSTLFLTILFSLGYSVRRKIPALFSIVLIFLLSAACYLGFYLGTARIAAYDPTLQIQGRLERRAGLILSRLETDMILLREDRDSPEPGFPRVISFPERPLVYQETAPGPNSTVLSLPLEEKTYWFIQSILIDFTLAAREFDARFGQGLFSFLVYGCSLFFLLASLRFVMGLSSWPLANLFLGAVAFRLVLGLVVFLEAREVKTFLFSFVDNRVPQYLVVPALYLCLAALISVYTFLAFLVRRKRKDDV